LILYQFEFPTQIRARHLLQMPRKAQVFPKTAESKLILLISLQHHQNIPPGTTTTFVRNAPGGSREGHVLAGVSTSDPAPLTGTP